MANGAFRGPSSQHLTAALPFAPVLFGLTGIGIGIYSFISPNSAIRMFGLQPSSQKLSSTSVSPKAFETSTIQASGIRNIGSGLALTGLVTYWQYSFVCRTSPFAALVAKQCLGVCLLSGCVVGLGDAWITYHFAKDEGVSGEAQNDAFKASSGHGITAALMFTAGLLLFL